MDLDYLPDYESVMTSKVLPLPIALLWIIGSIFLVSGSAYSLLKIMHGKVFQGPHHPTYMIHKIIQTGPHRDALKTDDLAEMIGLSRDRPTSIQTFDPQQAIDHLLEMPMIKEASVMVLKPDTVYVDYTMRQPLAMIYDYENIAVDEEGHLFPFSPFYSPKALPEFYFGSELLASFSFKTPLQGEGWLLAMRILKMLKTSASEANIFIKRIDVSHAFERSLGKQEIVIDFVNEEIELSLHSSRQFTHHIRLHPQDYEQQLGNYFVLHDELLTSTEPAMKERVIDLRMMGLAFVQDIHE